jgi:hypothetical protein
MLLLILFPEVYRIRISLLFSRFQLRIEPPLPTLYLFAFARKILRGSRRASLRSEHLRRPVAKSPFLSANTSRSASRDIATFSRLVKTFSLRATAE